jgi:hypothetical protein
MCDATFSPNAGTSLSFVGETVSFGVFQLLGALVLCYLIFFDNGIGWFTRPGSMADQRSVCLVSKSSQTSLERDRDNMCIIIAYQGYGLIGPD